MHEQMYLPNNLRSPSPVTVDRSITIHENDFVQFRYDDSTYCGEVINVHADCVRIRAMEQCTGGKYKWPRRDDVHEYPLQDIVKKIGDPIPVGSRGQFRFE